ncbi:hypothetical protein KQ939_07875 [Planococcus sp. CP5-4]|uniref:hypothetical protein n=1 Tax=unclassified Planococcus (in: firmicutes) TaxID=2662419 RepID=UPI001C2157CD|nr:MULTISPECIES: hypothetical protein [unclassified Planococcus (in: firmicutes)]MBU9671818.1 hypothetical protein [Planococcus sp. CP5-4_YE]MBV0909138.1 hypothetical protein [Planococcus sp. CP5-4_UN]MBW6063630.1 hypothetical protein [Planococcus sp. CP5-4]
MTQPLISLLILGFIVMTHIMVWKWAAYLQEKYADDASKRRIAAGILFMSIAALFGLTAFFLMQSSI